MRYLIYLMQCPPPVAETETMTSPQWTFCHGVFEVEQRSWCQWDMTIAIFMPLFCHLTFSAVWPRWWGSSIKGAAGCSVSGLEGSVCKSKAFNYSLGSWLVAVCLKEHTKIETDLVLFISMMWHLKDYKEHLWHVQFGIIEWNWLHCSKKVNLS